MFSESFQSSPEHLSSLVSQSLLTTSKDIKNLLNNPHFSPKDLPLLLSPAAESELETLAQLSYSLTRKRFGNTMQLFIPMYLSNECYNSCSYCGFSYEHKYKRVTLDENEILQETQLLQNKGFQHILLLTGESPKKVGVSYIQNAIKLVQPYMASIGIEVQPLTKNEYEDLISAGADSLSLYQESYHPETYAKHHTFGIKRQFKKRLNALEEGAQAGFHRINLGALLGLYDWRFEALALGEHLHYMQKKYWKSKYGVSFPRINDMVGSFKSPYPVSDKNLTQLIVAFRLCFPDLNITLSTRESATLRNNLAPLGITTMSAESKTSPGGYSCTDAEEQFSINDERSIDEISSMLKSKNLEPVQKDWDLSLMSIV